MRIYLQPPSLGNRTIDGDVRAAHQLLHNSLILSARAGGIISTKGNDCGVILIERCEVAKALAILKDAGVSAAI
jgi:hypothetical protein